MAKKRWLLALILALLAVAAVAGVTIGYREHRKKISDEQAKAFLAAQAKAAMDARDQKAFARESDEMLIANQRRTDYIKLKNLRLEDEIAEMEGRPHKNRLAIVQVESKWDYDDLFKSWQDETAKQLALLEKGDPSLFAVVSAPMETYLDTIISRRLANAAGDENAKKVAARDFEAAHQRLVAIFQGALDARRAASIAEPRQK
jgi:hypothetical protein